MTCGKELNNHINISRIPSKTGEISRVGGMYTVQISTIGSGG